jgi:hypothetical protein
VSAPETVVYAITWLFSVAFAAHTYCESGLVDVSPNPPVAPEIGGAGVGVAGAGVADGNGVAVAMGGVALAAGVVDDPHPMSAMLPIAAMRSQRIRDENSRPGPSSSTSGSVD